MTLSRGRAWSPPDHRGRLDLSQRVHGRRRRRVVRPRIHSVSGAAQQLIHLGVGQRRQREGSVQLLHVQVGPEQRRAIVTARINRLQCSWWNAEPPRHTPVVVVTCRSVGFSVLVLGYVLGELGAQSQFLPLLFAVVRRPRYLLRLRWTVYSLQLWQRW